ncbi:MAG: hypothetical protein AAF891_11240, partial [Pseudomonadota bacterium]
TDKQSLLATLMEDHLTMRQEALDAALSQAGDSPLDQLEAFTRSRVRFDATHPLAARMLEAELRSLEGDAHARCASQVAAYERTLGRVLAAGADAQDFAVPAPALAAAAVLGLLSGAGAYGRGPDAMPVDRVQRISWNMVRRAVGARGYQ